MRLERVTRHPDINLIRKDIYGKRQLMKLNAIKSLPSLEGYEFDIVFVKHSVI